ncbi:hypothetical protein SAMN05421647_101469 [Marinobacterium stanieri]|uniref:Uncharacterized protein n=1 Tax=Marinobacterium stanieri TaxID=49186 RepID=A0A1N6NPI9_9GAMM|nr:hypothetical protein SAMN05421647_101469 [Marinobacterium stanieri]
MWSQYVKLAVTGIGKALSNLLAYQEQLQEQPSLGMLQLTQENSWLLQQHFLDP